MIETPRSHLSIIESREMRADLHVHTRFSEPPSEWYMQRLNLAESYSDPFAVYERAKKSGMSIVAITDHNCIEGALLLKEAYPSDVLVGVETTVCFPEDGCKIHLLLYGLSETEYSESQKLRKDIYQLRDYVRQQKIALSVAHGTYSVVNQALTVDHIEKLILLFDVFEGMNGMRSRSDNMLWTSVLLSLTPERIDDLQRKHGIEPFGSEPWIKGFTGGSDDHGGIFVGRTFTIAEAATADEFLDCLRGKRTVADGKHSDFKVLTFNIYKVLHDLSSSKPGRQGLLSLWGRFFFDEKAKGLNLKHLIHLARLRWGRGKKKGVSKTLYDLLTSLRKGSDRPVEDAMDDIFRRVSDLSNEFLKRFFEPFSHNLTSLNLVAVARNISESFPGIILSLPFLLTTRHLTRGRHLTTALVSRFCTEKPASKILWFTDTLNELNGVSVTLKEIGWLSEIYGVDLKIVTCLRPEEISDDIPPNVISLPFIHQFSLPYYERYVLKIPALLDSLKQLYALEPDRIFISTPGPVGLLGIAVARLLHLKSVGIYHTDFTMQARQIVDDRSISDLLESYTHWFYSLIDEVRVPSRAYIDVLSARGFDRTRLTLFRRGLNIEYFSPKESAKAYVRKRYGLGDGPVLLFVGRVSRDKNLPFLCEVCERLASKRNDLNLLVVGDGPFLPEMKRALEGGRVTFTERLEYQALPTIYSGCDLLLFPSTTDTFGRVVLEAQACGLPAVVSDVGGPREIIEHGKTGLVAISSLSDWEAKVEAILSLWRRTLLRTNVCVRMPGAGRPVLMDGTRYLQT